MYTGKRPGGDWATNRCKCLTAWTIATRLAQERGISPPDRLPSAHRACTVSRPGCGRKLAFRGAEIHLDRRPPARVNGNRGNGAGGSVKESGSALANLDLNLLVFLRELLSARDVTRAAERIGVTQPTTSAALARLRRHFDDELLVRRRGGYALSPLGRGAGRAGGAVVRGHRAAVHHRPVRSRHHAAEVRPADARLRAGGRGRTALARAARPSPGREAAHPARRGPPARRAGATIDVADDEADRGRRFITCPTLVLWCQTGPVGRHPAAAMRVWCQWAPRAEGHELPCGRSSGAPTARPGARAGRCR